MRKRKILFHICHPSYYHLFKNVIKYFNTTGIKCYILINKKDILEDLLRADELDYYNILPEGRAQSNISLVTRQVKQILKLLFFCMKKRPDILIGHSTAMCLVGRILGIFSIAVNDDSVEAAPVYEKVIYPFADRIVVPVGCSTGGWGFKTIQYNGFHELAYLHPDYFTPDKSVIGDYANADKPFFLLRFVKLSAYHDRGKKGIDRNLAVRIIDILNSFGRVYIVSERELGPELKPYRIKIDSENIHHLMAFATLYIGDSQTMAAEAAVLGTPFIRYSDFVGKINHLDQLENKYHLGFGIKPENPQMLLNRIKELMGMKDLKKLFLNRKKKMLSEKIDVSNFFIQLIESYLNRAKQNSKNHGG
ncbi:MAG: DUF354 domain-containing protein [Candidatus Omnitrophica bacterium]|nr:DUF354 domain-containing protein [Candidatus Omnitrophota bacterium]